MNSDHGETAHRDDLVSRTVEVLIESERYQTALETLDERISGAESLSDSGHTLLLALSALVYALIGRAEIAADIAAEAERKIEKAPPDEMILRARFALIEEKLLRSDADLKNLANEIENVASAASAYEGGIRDYDLARVRGDLAMLGGDVRQAITHYEKSLRAPIPSRWTDRGVSIGCRLKTCPTTCKLSFI